MRQFNTAGPVVAADHYLIPPLSRLDVDELLALVRDRKHFVLHAPRQTGKTSALLALRDLLNARGDFRAVYANVESGQSAREDVAEGMRAILAELALQAGMTLGDESLEAVWPDGPRGADARTGRRDPHAAGQGTGSPHRADVHGRAARTARR